MAIACTNGLAMDTPSRNTVIVIGDFDLDPKPFRSRKLELYKPIANEVAEFINFARGIIVADFPGKFGLIRKCYENIFPTGEDHGLALAVIAHSPEDFKQIEAIKNLDRNSANSTIYEIGEIENIAEDMARHKIGRSPCALQIEPKTLPLCEDEILLLRRAFHDCGRIYLDPLGGGKASMSVFRVHAWMT